MLSGRLPNRGQCAELCKRAWRLWHQWNQWNTKISNLRVFNALVWFNSPRLHHRGIKHSERPAPYPQSAAAPAMPASAP